MSVKRDGFPDFFVAVHEVSCWPVSTVRGGASIRPQLGAKRTLRIYRRSVEIDPYATSATPNFCTAN